VQLEPEIIPTVAARAWFYFLIYDYHDLYLDAVIGDATVLTGQGVDALDQVEGLMQRPFPAKFLVQLDVGSIQAEMRNIDAEDLAAIRTAYVELYGTVDKPDVYPGP
jgi:hypothetical protein